MGERGNELQVFSQALDHSVSTAVGHARSETSENVSYSGLPGVLLHALVDLRLRSVFGALGFSFRAWSSRVARALGLEGL